MAIAITAVAIICIGSVSAADETVDANLTVDDSSLEISELNGGDDIDDVAMKDGNVYVENEDILSASDEDVLKADVTGYGYIWNNEKDGRPSAASYNTPTTSDQTYNDYITGQTVSIDLWMKSLSGTWYLNVNNEDKSNYYASNSYSWDDGVFNYQFTESGTYTIFAYYKGSSDNYVTNKLIFNVKEATKETATSLSLDKTTIAPGDSVRMTPSANVKGTTDEVTTGEFEIYVNYVLVSTINVGESYDYANTTESIYYAYAKYIASSGYENSTSESKTFVINSDTSVVATTTAINLDKSIIEPGADVIITPTVTTPGGDVTGTVDLYDGDDNLIQANAVIGNPFTYTVSNVAGDYQIYARYLGNNDLKYMPSNSTKTSYKVKGQLKINLTVDGKTDFKAIGAYSSYSSNIINYVFYANCSGYAPLLKVYDVYDGETNLVYDGNVHGDSQEITMWFSYQNERGAHIVYAEFEGDDEYLPSRSNNVTFNVYEQKSYSNSMSSYSRLNFNPTTVMEGDYIAITPSIQYYSSGYKDAVGTVTIYDDSQRTVELGTVNVGEAFTYRVPFSDSTSQYTYYVYATYNGGYDDVSYTAFESGNLQGSFTVTIPEQTTLALENLSDTNIDFGNTVTVKPTLIDSDNNEVSAGTISWYVDGEWVCNLTATESYTTSTDLTAGTHTISAKYIGGNGYKESDSENNISIIINEEIKLLKIEIDAVEYPNEVMATLTASEIGTYTITIGSKTIPVEITESDNGQKTVSLGKFNAGDDYEATVTSDSDAALTNSTPFAVNKGTLTLNIATAGNNTLKDEGTKTITATSTASDADGIVQYFEGATQIGENSTLGAAFDVSSLSVGTHTITVKYIDNNYNCEDQTIIFTVKGDLTITLARNGEGLVKPGDTVYFTITYSESVTENLELWVNDTKLGNEDGSSSTSVNFDSSDIGSNKVFIKFLGNDDYEACVSNNVTVEVIKPLTTTVTIELSSSEVVPGKNITISPNVLDENGNEVTIGVVRIYDNMYANNDPIATINAGETANFTDLVNYAGTVRYLYAKYAGADSEDASYEASPVSAGVSYTVVSDNRIELTASEYNIYAGQSVDITAAVNGNGVITLKINGDDNGTLTKDEAKSFTLNEVGEYTFVAAYTRGTDYYISAVSEPITVHVTEKPVQNEITVSVEDVVLPGNATVIVTAIVDGIYTVDVNQTPVTVNVVGGKGNNTIKLSAGEYYANVTGHEDAKITNAVFTVSPDPKVGELIIRDVTYPQNATIEISGDGNVTIYVEYYLVKPLDGATTERITFNVGENNKVIENLINGSYTGAFSFVVNQTGEFTVNASYYGWKLMEGEYSFASENILKYSVTIKELPTDEKKNISLTVLVDGDEDDYVEADWSETFEIETYASDDISGVIIYREGETELGRANIGEVFELNASTLGLGEHNITAIFEGNDSYNLANRTFTIDVSKKIIWYTLQIDDVAFPDHAVGKFYGESIDGKYTITINGTDYTVEFEWYGVDGTVSFNITKLPAGTYKVSSVKYEDMEHYEIGVTTIEGLNTLPTFEVKAGEVTLDVNVLSVSNGTAPTFSIDLENATGSLTVRVGNNTYTNELVNGKAIVEITDLPSGDHEATVTFNSTNGNYRSSSIQTSFNVKPKEVPDVNNTLNVDVPSGSLNPVFTINLPSATGNLTVTIGDKKYTRELVNGTATITVDDLLPGSYNATVTYSGDKNHAGISKNTTFTVPTPKLTGKNVAVIYSAAASYKVLVTVNGKALAGEKVSVKFNGKTYSLTTDKNGYATLKLNTKVKVKKYTINVEYKGVKVSNALIVKHLIKAKNIKAKKSKRVLKIKVSTNKVNGKYLKGKKLTLKVKGKTIKAKINKNGVATFKVKKSILNKLKVGKKYKYKVSYGKDTVTKKITVRR